MTPTCATYAKLTVQLIVPLALHSPDGSGYKGGNFRDYTTYVFVMEADSKFKSQIKYFMLL